MADNSNSCGQISVEDHIGLLGSCVLKFVKNGPIQDSELYSVGCLALMEAARTFDPTKSKFCTWATRIINQRIIDEIKKNAKVRESLSVDLSAYPDEQDEGRAVFPVHLLPTLLEGSDDEAEKRMLVGHYIEGKSLSELGREFGYSKEWIRKKMQFVVAKIRNENFCLLESYL